MSLTYFKRYCMEIDLNGRMYSEPELPSGYTLIPWSPNLLEEHADTKFRSFRTEIDSNVFPCLGDQQGCLNLMSEIARKKSFLPGATWLAQYEEPSDGRWEYCGTVQGIREKIGTGAIQNLGITPGHRNRRLGTCLLFQSLEGFREHGLRRVFLEVTSHNVGAIRLYERLGFRKSRTVYKAVELACS